MNLRLCAFIAIALPSPVCAQAPAPEPAARPLPAERRVTLTAGTGNAMGWLGAQGERYFAHARRSIFLGLGYMPDVDGDDTSGLAAAAGIRGYTGGDRHRAFLELSLRHRLACAGARRARAWVHVAMSPAAGGGMSRMPDHPTPPSATPS